MTFMYYLCIREIKYYLNHINKMDNNNQNQEGQQLQIDLSPEIAKGVYTNFQIISHSSSDTFPFSSTLLTVYEAFCKIFAIIFVASLSP